MEDKITLITKTNEDDYKALIFFNLYQKKRGLLILLSASAVISFAAILCRFTGILPIPDLYFYVCIAFWALIALQSFLYQINVRRFLASDKLIIGTENTIVIDEDGIVVESKNRSSAVYSWDKFFKAYATKKYYFIYLNTLQALILPKRDYDADDLPVMDELIKAKLGNRLRGAII